MNLLKIKDFIWSVFHLAKASEFNSTQEHLNNFCRLLKKRHVVRKRKIHFTDRMTIKELHEKLLSIGKPSFKCKEEIAFFIEKAIHSKQYRKQLILDGHDENEVEEQMKLADEWICNKAKVLMHQTFTKQLMFDIYSADTKDKLFFDALKYYRKYSKNFDTQSNIDKYFAVYGIPEKLPELILKASIANDNVLENALRKHYKQ